MLVASCGSRTGLFGVDGASTASPPTGADASTTVDARVPIDATIDGPVPCTPGKFDFEAATAQLMFVIDRSGSMALTLDGKITSFGPTRWDVLRDALAQTIEPIEGTLAMGAKFYPEVTSDDSTPEEACRTDVGVAIAPTRNNASTILGVFRSTSPGGGTPTAEAVRLAAQYITTTRGIARAIVLATDGAPNCNGDLDALHCTCTAVDTDGGSLCGSVDDGKFACLDDKRAIATIQGIFDNQRVPVYVIGIGGTERAEFVQVLGDMAVAGGRPRPTTPRYYSVQTPSEMSAALATIQASIAKCTYLTPSAPDDPSAISVEIDGAAIPRDTSHASGWDWLDQAYGTLQFFGPACAAAQAAAAKITGTVRCK